MVNAWGGYSKATKQALERLHYGGFLRIAHRQKGIRVYEAVPTVARSLSPDERLQGLVMAVVNILAPVPEKTLHSIASYLRRPIARAPQSSKDDSELDQRRKTGTASHRGSRLSLAGRDRSFRTAATPRAFPGSFDPVVWDRRRFEHLWGWPYRFEAYTPLAKRVRGYYAMPLSVVRSGNRMGKRRDGCGKVGRKDRLCWKATRRSRIQTGTGS